MSTYKLKNATIPFKPNTFSYIDPSWIKKRTPIHHSISVKSPCRVHFTPFDFTAMRPPKSGGGGIGISHWSDWNEITVDFNKDNENSTKMSPITTHYLNLFQQLVSDDSEVRVNISRKITQSHSGFGSSATFGTGLFIALNELYGKPFTPSELYTILTHNAIENHDSQQIRYSFDTGVAHACLLFGGLVITDLDGKFLGTSKIPHPYIVISKTTKEKVSTKSKYGVIANQNNDDVDLIKSLLNIQQKKYGKKLKNLFYKLKKLSLENNDEYLKMLWDINKYGTFRMFDIFYNRDMYLEYENIAKINGAIYAGVSSAGPTMFSLCPNKQIASQIKKQVDKRLGNYFDHTNISQAGSKVLITQIS